MGLYTRPDSPFFWWSVTIDGRRFRGCCRTAARDEALRILKSERARLKREYAGEKKAELTVEGAFTRYAEEHAMRLPSAPDIARIGENMIRGLGGEMRLSRLLPDAVATYVARRRAEVSDASVNRELTILRAILRMAAARWGCAVATIDWKRQFLMEPAPRDRLLSPAEEARLFAALRPDFHAFIRFALLSGQRLGNIRRLRWSEVDLEQRVIRLRLKSRRPGGEPHLVPISPALAAILATERGRHPEFVFTYVAQRARSAEGREKERTAGQRQPFTRAGWRKAWAAALKAAGITDLRFHDLRHTALTRVYRATGNLRATQKLAGHKSISTTLRYENSGLDDVREALEAAEEEAAGPARTSEKRA